MAHNIEGIIICINRPAVQGSRTVNVLMPWMHLSVKLLARIVFCCIKVWQWWRRCGVLICYFRRKSIHQTAHRSTVMSTENEGLVDTLWIINTPHLYKMRIHRIWKWNKERMGGEDIMMAYESRREVNGSGCPPQQREPTKVYSTVHSCLGQTASKDPKGPTSTQEHSRGKVLANKARESSL